MNSYFFFYIFGLTLCHFVLPICGVKKILKYDDDIYNSENWIVEEDPEECEGLIFPDTVNGFTILDDLNVKEIILPREGQIFLSHDADIEINIDSTDPLNCVLLNKTKFEQVTWPDRINWKIEGSDNNPAMPDKESLPCEHDDVIIPLKSSTLNIYYNSQKIKFKSFQIGNQSLTNDDLEDAKDSEEMNKLFSGFSTVNEVFDITGRGCEDPMGCVCGNTDINAAVCWTLYENEEKPCLDPITPVGFCAEICGAYILFKPKKTFKIDTIREMLKSYQSYSYVSKVEQEMIEYIQVVFTETEFQGNSLYDANDLHQKLLNEPNLGAKSIKLTSCKVKSNSSTVGTVFGALFGVFAIFSLIFLIYSPRTRQLIRINLVDRLHLPIRTSRATFTTQFMAKYRKDEDSGPFLDSQSTRGSVVSIEKSFENPMFATATTSSSSTNDANITSEIVKSENEMENPLFDAHRLEELRDVGKNGDLVDLSESNTNVP